MTIYLYYSGDAGLQGEDTTIAENASSIPAVNDQTLSQPAGTHITLYPSFFFYLTRIFDGDM